jgi:fused signal recognition particle receptor
MQSLSAMESLWPVVVAVLVLVLAGLLAWALLRRRRREVAAPAAAAPAARPLGTLERALEKTRARLGASLEAAFSRAGSGTDAALADLEEVLVSADVGAKVSGELVQGLRPRLPRGADADALREALRGELEAILAGPPAPAPHAKPWVILVAGVNGVGKTTTIGRLAAMHRSAGRRVMLVAADTFRAAASEQLAVWAERTGAEIVRQAAGADPSAVVFDGMKSAVARGIDVVLVDTAGRLHTRTNLMEELRKIRRIIARELPEAPHETLLVVDATTGQNAVSQARVFTEALGITGLVLTKLDGTARGGVAIAVRRELSAPIAWIGVGEGVDDLRAFDAKQFAAALVAPPDARDAHGARSP